jgi:hypothetical protein
MSKKIADLMTLALAGMFILMIAWQALDYFHFRQAGWRFTANNGQDLCWSVQELQRYNKLPVRECEFIKAAR